MSAPESKRARRDAAREQARLARERQRRRDARMRALLVGGVSLVAVAVVAVIALVIVGSAQQGSVAAPANTADGGITLVGVDGEIRAVRSDPEPSPPPAAGLRIELYEDYFCPVCRAFEDTNGSLLEALVAGGRATMTIHPVAILDSRSMGTDYSTRAANAAACVADDAPDRYPAVHDALYARQPAEGTPGLDDERLLAILAAAGVDGPELEACVRDVAYRPWVSLMTDRAADDPALQGPRGFGTPTVLVNGERYPGAVDDRVAFQAFLDAALAG